MCSHLPRSLSPVLRLSSPPPPPFFSTVSGSGGGVCRRRPAAQNSPPGPPSRPVAVAIGRQLIFFVLLIGISKAVVLLGLRLRSPPVASGRLRSLPVTPGRLRSPPVASGRLRSPPADLARQAQARDWPGVGSGGDWGCLVSRWVVGHCCFSARTRFGD